jgi:hypothetical protein
MDVRLLSVAAAGGVVVVAALAAGYLWGARSSGSGVSAGGSHVSEGIASEPAVERARQSAGARAASPPAFAAAASPGASAAPAPEPSAPSPEEGRRRAVARITTSGPDTRGLVTDARRVGENWESTLAAQGLAVSFGDWHCFRAGCLVEAKHASPGVVDQATEVVTRSSGFTGWNGEKIRTGPVPLPDGKTDVVWILLAPPEGEAVLPAELNAAPAAGGPGTTG